MVKKFRNDTEVSAYHSRVETMCGKVLDAPWMNEKSMHVNCTRCQEIFQEIINSIEKFKCNLCDYSCINIAHNCRTSHIENLHPSKIKTDSDRKSAVKLFTIIFKGKIRGHELKYSKIDKTWQGSCTCKKQFEPAYDMDQVYRQFTEHVREEGVLPIGF